MVRSTVMPARDAEVATRDAEVATPDDDHSCLRDFLRWCGQVVGLGARCS